MRKTARLRPVIVIALFLIVFQIGVAVAAQKAEADLFDLASPHYFYDRETAFLLNYGLDSANGGLYTAVGKNGEKLDDLPIVVWGFPADYVAGTDKSLYAQATCVRYFITEYQRVTASGVGVAEINNLLQGDPIEAIDLLLAAQSCADFTINHLEMAADAAEITAPGRLFYWASASEDGLSRFVDDTNPLGQQSSARSESIMPWSLAELALILKAEGGDFQPYLDAALRWWDWRQTTAAPLPPYGDPAGEASQQPCTDGGSNPDNCIPGIGRDLFLPALAFTLTEITGDVAYRDVGVAFANGVLGTDVVPNLAFPPADAFQDGAYASGYGRGVIFAKHELQNLGVLEDRDQWWDFGNYPARLNLDPRANDAFGENINNPFAHFGGREVVAGTQRALWFYYSFGENPAIFYAGTFAPAENLRQPLRDYWDYANEILWDDTAGVAAWLEAVNQPYKPCFSGGTDTPIGDWLPPVIDGQTIMASTDGVQVAINTIHDDPWEYLNWYFDGSGVRQVEVAYTLDSGATWEYVPGELQADGTYTALISAQPAGTTLQYYVRAMDWFSNWASFPSGAETWDTAGNTLTQDITLALSYTVS